MNEWTNERSNEWMNYRPIVVSSVAKPTRRMWNGWTTEYGHRILHYNQAMVALSFHNKSNNLEARQTFSQTDLISRVSKGFRDARFWARKWGVIFLAAVLHIGLQEAQHSGSGLQMSQLASISRAPTLHNDATLYLFALQIMTNALILWVEWSLEKG